VIKHLVPLVQLHAALARGCACIGECRPSGRTHAWSYARSDRCFPARARPCRVIPPTPPQIAANWIISIPFALE